jgi:nitrogen fixation protein NifB
MAFFVSLDALDQPTATKEMRHALKSPRTRKSPAPAPSDIPPELWERIKDHPCYSEEAHHYFARMHVAVAPACNIQCNYCNRKYDCSNESRPGVVSEKLTPEEANRKIIAVANEVPQLSVLGIAGPGDACSRISRRPISTVCRPTTSKAA